MEVVQKLIFFPNEITLLIFFTSENNSFGNMHVISSIFFCISLIRIYTRKTITCVTCYRMAFFFHFGSRIFEMVVVVLLLRVWNWKILFI